MGRPKRGETKVSVLSGSALRTGGDFQSQGRGGSGRPCFVSIRRASIHAAAQGCEFRGRLRLIDVLDPAWRPPDGPWRQNLLIGGRSAGPPIQTAPTPLFGPRNQIGAQGVAFDVSTHRKKMPVLLDRKGFESSLVQVARSRGTAVSVPTAASSSPGDAKWEPVDAFCVPPLKSLSV